MIEKFIILKLSTCLNGGGLCRGLPDPIGSLADVNEMIRKRANYRRLGPVGSVVKTCLATFSKGWFPAGSPGLSVRSSEAPEGLIVGDDVEKSVFGWLGGGGWCSELMKR